MTTTTKAKKVKSYNAERELAEIKRLFKSIEADRDLPTFLNFYLECFLLGNTENVNLKAMYPKVHRKLSNWFKGYKAKILSSHN